MNPYAVVRDFEARLAEYTGAPHVVCVHSCTSALLLAVAWHLRNHKPWPMEKASPPFQAYELGSLQNAVNRVHNENLKPFKIEIPKRTYISVPMSIIHAGGWPTFRDEKWDGAYQLRPLPVWDSARYFTAGLYRGEKREIIQGRMEEANSTYQVSLQRDCAGQMVCVSFHASKTLGIEQGGAILHDDPEADAWLRRARFDGRTEGVAPKDDTFGQVGWHCYMNPSTAAQGILKLHSLPRHNEPLENDPYPDLSQMDIFK